MRQPDKPLVWRLQQREPLSVPHSGPMPAIGGQCHELRVDDTEVTWRIVSAGSRRIARLCPARSRPMKRDKKTRLERVGWAVSSTAEFLQLDPPEARLIELKLALAAGVRRLRERRGMTQAALAKRLGSSQSRVAKMEAGDASVSFDLMIRTLLGIGAGPADIAKLIRGARAHRAA
jgi:DNA-binding XRE family transcriptional regulator